MLKPPLTNSACMRARFAARICESLMIWAETAEAQISQADETASRNGRMNPFENKDKSAAINWMVHSLCELALLMAPSGAALLVKMTQ